MGKLWGALTEDGKSSLTPDINGANKSFGLALLSMCRSLSSVFILQQYAKALITSKALLLELESWRSS